MEIFDGDFFKYLLNSWKCDEAFLGCHTYHKWFWNRKHRGLDQIVLPPAHFDCVRKFACILMKHCIGLASSFCELPARPFYLQQSWNVFVFFTGDPVTMVTLSALWAAMQYLGGKLSAAQLQVTGWVGSFRRSLQGALELVWSPSDEKQEVEEEEDVGNKEEEGGGEGGKFQRALSPLRSFARRSRRSLQRFSGRSQQPFQKRAPKTCSVRNDIQFDYANEYKFHE